MDTNYRLWFEAEEFLKREQTRLLRKYNCDTIQEVLEKLVQEHRKLLQMKHK